MGDQSWAPREPVGSMQDLGRGSLPSGQMLEKFQLLKQGAQEIQLMAQGAGVNMDKTDTTLSPREVTGWKTEEEDRSPLVACTWQGRMGFPRGSQTDLNGPLKRPPAGMWNPEESGCGHLSRDERLDWVRECPCGSLQNQSQSQ